ncbi:DUF6624 domain-containing protein [Chryseobacterium sp. CFBP8996]|uniref:DUF6624 domain-containing protein n=1 Tax=Chryseobacterium sp. CFBP8996 TaxID=3096529 RepID=UPI002A6A305D|nr:DUF6624 domain-containing protein [Chryseobacterium sp. CFBP8996]MDY0931692.1 DUF6624 domain-containing protein [Chryseobacterium sp. CFBP8996]
MKRIILFLTASILLASCATKLTNNKKEQLKEDLVKMVEIDQIAAYIPQGKYKSFTRERWDNFKDSVFTKNNKRVESMYRKYGFLGFDKVGKDGSNHFWLLVQHCDKYPEFQKEVLSSMEKEVKNTNANPNNYALLYDRVQVNSGLKQLFGTQVTYEVESTGRAIPKIGLVDSVNIDKLRKEYNLEPLKVYLNQMTTMHYEMNKEHYEKKGILKPNLY